MVACETVLYSSQQNDLSVKPHDRGILKYMYVKMAAALSAWSPVTFLGRRAAIAFI